MPLSHSRSMSDLHSEQHDSTKPRLIPSLPPSSQFPRHSPSRRTAALSLSPLKTENLYPRNRNSNETSGFGLGVNPSFGNRYILAPRPSPPSVLNSRPSPAQLRKSFSATSSGSGGFGFGTVSSGSGSSRSPERGRTRIKATGERKRKTRREGEEDRTGRSSSGSSKEIRKFFIEGQSTDNWSAMALFSATFKRFDPNSTGSISIRDFIPLIRQIEEELPGCNKYGILQKESEKIIYNTIEKAPDLTLTEEEFIQVFDDINKDQEGILQLMEVFKNAGKFAQEDVYEDVGDPEMVVRDGPPFSAGSPPLSPCFHEDGEGNSLWHALVGPVPSSPRDRRSFAYSEGDATGMLDTPLSTSTPMAMIATNRRAFPGVTTPDRRMSSPNRPGSNPTLRSGSPRPLSRGGGPTDKSFRAGPPRMAPLRPAGDDQAVSRPSSRGRSRGGSSSSRSRRRRSLTGLAPFEIDMELALFHPNLLSLETPTTIENLRALTALDVMTIITDFRYAWAIAEQRERELKDLHTRINEVESNTVENADWDEGRIIEIQKKYEEADAAVTTVNEHNAALIQDLHRTEALYVELENDMEKLTKELEETVRVAEREKAERLKISEKLSRSQKHLARVEENGLDSLRSLDKNKEEVIKYVAKINSLQEAIKKRDEIIKEVKNDLEESNEKINVLNEELVACRANVEHLTPGVTPSQRTRTSLGAMLGGVKLDGPSDDENRWEYNSEPSASEGNGSFGSMGSMGHDTTIGEYPHGYRDKDREGYVPKPATGDRVEDEAKIQTQVSEEEEEEQSGSKSPMLRDANTQTQITSGDEPNELSSQDITTQTKLLKLQDIKEMAKQYPYRELVLDMARDYPFGQLIADLADEYPGLLTPLPPINKDDEKLSEPEDLGELSEGEDLSFSEDEPEDEEQQEEGLVNADDQKQQEQGEARDQTIIKIALPPSRKPVPKESCSSGEFPKRGGWAGHNTGDINTGNSSDPTSGAPAGGGAAGDTGVPGGEGGGSGGSAASGALGVSGQAAAGNITRENPRWLHPHDFGMGIPKNRLPVVAGAPPRNPRTFPPADRGQTEPYEDYMQYYLGNYLSEEQRVRPGARGQDYEAYRQYYFGAYMNPPGDNSGNDLADNPRRRRDKPSGDGAYIGKFRIPAPDGEYVERISTTLETRVRLQELNTRPRLTIAEAQEVARFVDSQFNPPENVILKTIWLLAGRVERASRRAIREAEWPREERLETLIPYNNPFGILGWPWKMLWHILRSMDWADYQALASTENIALVMKNNGMIGLDVFPSTGVPPPPTGAPPPPAGASLPPTGGTTASPATPVRGKGAAGPSASGGGGPGVARTPLVDPMTGLRNTLRPYARRIPLGQAAELLQAGPRPAAAWSILSFILICGLTGLTMFNVYMYTRLKVKQRGWEDSLGVYTNRPNWYDSCYMACSGNQYQYSPPQGLLHVYERFIDYVGPLLGFDDDCVALPPT